MSDNNGQRRARKTTGGDAELRFVGVEFKPAPDAQDRLRRLFTILAGHFADQGLTGSERGVPAQAPTGEGEDGEEAGQ